ncbi:hypothetical protein SEA_KUDEFRE_62 [Gordonia phage Kudefre]|uniref:Uncharacterized protein n=1 Tax=Gordonia phage Kudefre TaxID=2885975 RepID=A0AAE8Y657_9CAUD|nr:hypothetical protein L3Y24_gp062 [Gordonia phage Kudefre]UDL15292.1 hypothetical protein SEA_KUDEFRE_62 [Gordonia phage Kudefre]
MSLDASEWAQLARRLWVLSKELHAEPLVFERYPYAVFRDRKKKYDRVRAKALLRAPVRDPNDESRKMNADDRDAWVESQPEVMAAFEEYMVAEVAYEYFKETVWNRKLETEILRTLSADKRAEMNVT